MAEKGDEMGETVEAFIRLQDRDMLYRYILAVDKLVGARIWLFDDNYELLAASNYENVQETGENASMKDFLSMVLLRNRCCRKASENWIRI